MVAEGTRLDGGCLCGAIRYTLTGPSAFVSQCCCKDCQKATGTGHTTIVGIHRSQLALEGTPKTYTNSGDTGGRVTRHFCGECAGRLYTSGDLPGEMIMVQAGSLDDPDAIYPDSVIYLKDAPRWDHFDPDIPKFEAMRPRPTHVTPGPV
ncbi:MAG TPA: GFA family protein [Allosphingosinicella sp.]|nr:GFA family protein [Allosphingosinicella sp.]